MKVVEFYVLLVGQAGAVFKPHILESLGVDEDAPGVQIPVDHPLCVQLVHGFANVLSVLDPYDYDAAYSLRRRA